MDEFAGTKDAEGMVWVGGGFMGCSHDPANREVTVEGGVGCANCGALLVRAGEVPDGVIRERPSEKQVKYEVRGHLARAQVFWETDDLEQAVDCAHEISRLGGYAAVLQITTEEPPTGV